jgi:ABC-type uncharacterized transport system substrate-binding protein
MERRSFIAAIASGLLAAPLAAEAQQAGKVYRVGLISMAVPVAEMAGPNPTQPWVRAFLEEMRERSYVEGQNFVLERRSLEGRLERAAGVVAELVSLKVDVIMTTIDPMTQEAKRVTTAVPIVMVGSSAPVEAGLVASLARPGGNVTGLTLDTGLEVEGKRLQLLRDALPGVSRVACIGDKLYWESGWGKSARAAARALGLTLLLAEYELNDYKGAFGFIDRERPDAIIAAYIPHNLVYRHLIVEFAAKKRLPGMYGVREFVDAGGLMSYGIDTREVYRRAATYVDKILKGAKPADLPVEQPTKFELVINMKTAKALGLTIPQSVLVRADEVIE